MKLKGGTLWKCDANCLQTQVACTQKGDYKMTQPDYLTTLISKQNIDIKVKLLKYSEVL